MGRERPRTLGKFIDVNWCSILKKEIGQDDLNSNHPKTLRHSLFSGICGIHKNVHYSTANKKGGDLHIHCNGTEFQG